MYGCPGTTAASSVSLPGPRGAGKDEEAQKAMRVGPLPTLQTLACCQRLLHVVKTNGRAGSITSHMERLIGVVMPLSPTPGAKRSGE